MLKNLAELQQKVSTYINELDTFCKQNDLVGKIKVDHIGLKCGSKEVYEQQRALFEYDSNFIYQSIISKRRIAIIRLAHGIDTTIGTLDFLELSDQKPDASQKDGFDHVEIVPITITYDQLLEQLRANNIVLKETIRPHHSTFDSILPSGFILRLSREILIDKIKREEMY